MAETDTSFPKNKLLVFSIVKVAEKTRLEDAIQDAKDLGINPEEVISTYKNQFDITGLDERIRAADKREARDWLLMED